MTAYNTYQEAKIANPESEIVTDTHKNIDEFGADKRYHPVVANKTFTSGYEYLYSKGASPRIHDGYFDLCNPADHCMTVEKFLADGHKFVGGDIILSVGGYLTVVEGRGHVNGCNESDVDDGKRFILSAAAFENQMNIDKVETQTPEEKGALDSIKPVHLRDYQKKTQTEHQEEMSAFSGESSWNGEGLPPAWFECEIYCPVNPAMPGGDKDWMKTVIVSVIDCGFGAENTVIYKTPWSGQWYVDAHPSSSLKFRKPETKQQREDRERLEAAYDLYCEWRGEMHESLDIFKRCNHDNWLAIVDKTNYRKEM